MDGDHSNDTAYSVHVVTDSLYARDDSGPIGAVGIGAGTGGYMGQSYAINTAAKIKAVEIYFTASDAGEPLAAAVWSIGPDGQPDQIVAATDTLFYPDDFGGYFNLPIHGGEKALTPGNYVVTAIEFDSTLQLAVSQVIFTPGTT